MFMITGSRRPKQSGIHFSSKDSVFSGSPNSRRDSLKPTVFSQTLSNNSTKKRETSGNSNKNSEIYQTQNKKLSMTGIQSDYISQMDEESKRQFLI